MKPGTTLQTGQTEGRGVGREEKRRRERGEGRERRVSERGREAANWIDL